MKTRWTIPAGLLLATTLRAAPDSAASSRVDSVFAGFHRSDSPGCAVAVARGGETVLARGYGMASLELGVAITPDTVFDIGSVAKQFTAASLLLLAQDGKLTLDDDIRRYVPELPDFGVPVTLRQMLHHTSGIRDYTDLLALAGARTADVTTDREALEILSRQRGLDFPPGSRYRYSNSGYFLLSIVVQRVAGKPLKEFARDRIFLPLGMMSTRFVNDHRDLVPRRANGYSKGATDFRVAASDWEQNGDGGMQTTVRDLLRWDRNFERHEVGGSRLSEELTRPGMLADGTPIDYALALRVNRDRGLLRVRHGGSWAGFRAEFLRYPERRVSVVTLCNFTGAAPSDAARAVAAIYLPELSRAAPQEEPAAAKPERPSAARAANDDLDGVYWNPDRLEVRWIREKDGRLSYRAGAGESESALVADTPGRYHVEGSPLVIAFEARAEESGGRDAGRALVERSPDDPLTVWTRVARTPWKPDPAELKRFSGTYYSAELDAIYRVATEKGRLVLSRRGAEPETLEPVLPDAFETPDLGVILFRTDRAGRPAGFSIAAGISKLSFSPIVLPGDRVAAESSAR